MQENQIDEESALVEIRLTDEERDTLIRVYVDSTMSAVSQEHFQAVLFETDGDIKEALFQTALNEIINKVIEHEVEKIKSAYREPPVVEKSPFWPVYE